MFIYDDKVPMEVTLERPDPEAYYLLDTQLEGTKAGLKQAMVYVRQAFMIHNVTFYRMFMRLGAKQITDMELLAKLIHLEHGVDDRYYDESNDDTPVFEYIIPDEYKHKPEQEETHHVNNDLTAAIMRNLQYEDKTLQLYKKVNACIHDKEAGKLFSYLCDSTQTSINTLKNMLNILTTHTELKEFGEGDTHESWDLDTGNYFGKLNPYFLTPDKNSKM